MHAFFFRLLTLKVVICLLGFGLTACATPTPPPITSVAPVSSAESSTISVVGTGVVSVPPDLVYIQVTVQRASLVSAQAALAANVAEVMALGTALHPYGVAEADIQTTRFSLQRYPEATPIEADPADATYRATFEAVHVLNIAVRNVAQLGDILNAIVASEARMVQYVTFTLADPTALETEARQKALAEALANAQQIAQATGLVLGKPLSVTEVSLEDIGTSFFGLLGGGQDTMTSANVQVSLIVNVVYAAK